MRTMKWISYFLIFTIFGGIGILSTRWIIPPGVAAKAHWAAHYKSLKKMVRRMDLVVSGTVLDTRPGRVAYSDGEDDSVVYTNVLFRVERELKGKASEAVITVEQTGGELPDGSVMSIDDGGPYEPGEQYLLFLKKQPDSDRYYLVNPQGRFHVKRGRLHSVKPDDPVARRLHRRSQDDSEQMLRRYSATQIK